jgi:hypothetical protein
MLNIHNASGTLPDDELLRVLSDQVPAPVRDRLEAWHDAHESRDEELDTARQQGFDEARDEFGPYQDAWQELFDVWEDCAASGVWPAESPTDGALAAAMADDVRKGAAALAAIRDVLSDLDKPGHDRRSLKLVREVLRAALED